VTAPRVRPRFRGISHLAALVPAIPAGIAFGFAADGHRARLAVAVFAASVVLMLGASALYHVVWWTPARRRWLARLDHAGVYGLIAGTYTPFGLLVLRGTWQVTVLAIVWSGAALSILLKLIWVRSPKWLAASLGLLLGWVGVLVFPQILHRAGLLAFFFVLAGGLCYTAGAIVYARRRPDPLPAVFGYHEIFHAFTIAAVAFQYAAVGLVVL
jgi:hemolysin III